ncbi:MAG: hypothetical protein K5984_03425 [Bacteroidales bacterium]|nr:hypothetical protein [Bacteroidales bacterium]
MNRKLVQRTLLALITVLAIAGCYRKAGNGTSTIKLVEDILADTSSVRYSLVKEFDENNVKGKIAVIAPANRADSLARLLLKVDIFDNVDGRKSPDGLPDFSGETILCMPDSVHASGGIYTGSLNQIRELTVKQVLRSIENGAKLVVLAPQLASLGLDDVDYLFGAVGKELPVIAMPVFDGDSTHVKSDSTVAEYCYTLLRKRNAFTHNIAYPKGEWLKTDSLDVQN